CSVSFSVTSNDSLGLHSFPTRRSSDLRPHPIRSKQINIGGLYFLGGASPTKRQWLLMGDLLHSAEISQFEYPTRRLREVISDIRSEEHTSELQSRSDLVCRLLLEKKNS